MIKKLLGTILFATLAIAGTSTTTFAHEGLRGHDHYTEFGICCNKQLNIPITPFDLVTAAYQGRFVEYGIPSHGGFEQAVLFGRVDGLVLTAAAFEYYRATADDFNGFTSFVEDVDDFLEIYKNR